MPKLIVEVSANSNHLSSVESLESLIAKFKEEAELLNVTSNRVYFSAVNHPGESHYEKTIRICGYIDS
jgi:hypothetical protein